MTTYEWLAQCDCCNCTGASAIADSRMPNLKRRAYPTRRRGYGDGPVIKGPREKVS
jgi:hypothetical protein